MDNIRKLVVEISIVVFIGGMIYSFEYTDEATGSIIFMFLTLGLIISMGWAIGSAKEKATLIDRSRFGISYRYYRTNVIPIGTIILTIISLIWLLIDKIHKAGVEIALGFFIGFGLLSFFELMYRWWKVTKYNGFTFSFNNHGVEIAKGSWSKEYPWSNYTSFSTVYTARFGNWVRFIPLVSMFVHDTDQNLINLYRKEEYGREHEWDPIVGNAQKIPYDRIATLPKNHQQVIQYIKKYLPESQKLSINERL